MATATAAASSTSGAAASSTSGYAQPQWSACLATTAIPLSASGDAWTAIPSFQVTYKDAYVSSAIPAAPASNAALSALVSAAYDSTNLYVFVQVTQGTLIVDFPNAVGNFNNDSVELYLDGEDSRQSTYDSHDFQLTVSAFNTGTAFQKGVFVDAGYSSAAQVNDGGYNVLYRVPWTMLGPNAGAIGFDIGVNANDGGVGERESQLVWSGSGANVWSDPQDFGTLVLSDTACND